MGEGRATFATEPTYPSEAGEGDVVTIEFDMKNDSNYPDRLVVKLFNNNTGQQIFSIPLDYNALETKHISTGTSLVMPNYNWNLRLDIGHVETIPVTETFEPTEDAYTQENKPNEPRGSTDDGCLEIEGYSGYSRHTWLKFDISSLPSNANIIDAKLQLYYYMVTCSDSMIGRTRIAANNWNEFTVTWNNELPLSTIISEITLYDGASGYYSWDVTSYIQYRWNRNEKVLTIAIDSPLGPLMPRAVAFSKNQGIAQYRPKLIIEYEA